MKNIINYTFLVVILFPPVAIGEPVILETKGTIQPGANIVVTGTGFGVNNAIGSIEWLGGEDGNIESGSLGSEITLPPNWIVDVTSSARQRPIYSSQEKHSGLQSIKSYFPLESQYTSGFSYDNGSEFSSAYATWWFKAQNLTFREGATTAQFKSFRATPGGGGGIYADQPHNWLMAQWALESGGVPTFTGSHYLVNFCDNNETPTYDETCYPSKTGDIYRPVGSGYIENQWVRVEVWIEENSTSSKDGTITILYHQQDQPPVSYANFTGNVATRQSTTPRWRYLVWQNYWGNGGDKGEFFTDDVFLQIGSQARVELGNAPSWSDCTHREIQIPTGWVDTEITVKANLGSFVDTDSIFLFVVDENGSVSNGYSVRHRPIILSIQAQ